MQKLAAVEEAKALMREAAEWSVWSWLMRKPSLRRHADEAWKALEDLDGRVRAKWSEDVKKAYRSRNVNGAVQRLRIADEEWRTAREQAEATFDEAERRMSTEMACEGAEQAIAAWELMEKAIRLAEKL